MKIDHVEIFVPDRNQAAGWYKTVLGFQIVERYRDWAKTGSGPLMISADTEREMIALFEGEPQGDHAETGICRLAFRVSGAEFVDFIKSSLRWSEPPLGVDDIKNHERAYSIYFTDPYGNPLELTTYDVDGVADYLGDQ